MTAAKKFPFEAKTDSPAYSDAELIKEVETTMAFEGMDLTEEEVQLLYDYKNGKVNGEELRRQILNQNR